MTDRTIHRVGGRARTPLTDVSTSLALDVLAAIDSPRSLTVSLLIRNGEWDQLVGLSCNPSDYLDSQSFRDAYQATVLLQKANHLPLEIDRRKVAVESFYKAERACESTNRRLLRFRNVVKDRDPFISGVFHAAAHLISNLLGRPDPDSLLEGCGFGPGVSSSVKGSKVGTYYKASGKPDVTPDLTALGTHFLNASHPLPSAILKADGAVSLLPSSMRMVRGNVVAFVPKNAKTDRSIAVEPHVNIYVQKGIGSFIRRALKRVDINLNDQSRNQRLAKWGSLHGHLATVDLSMASDTLSIELVRELLPPEWFCLLDMSRSKYGYVDGKWMRYQKFSSMGNGFTFELESLIFWALVRSTVDLAGFGGIVSVYGDDIICPSNSVELVESVLAFAGFTFNSTKSFANGNFRESCGEDFFLGVPVRPFFIRGPIKTLKERISIHNQITRYALRCNAGFGRDPRFTKILKGLRGASRYLTPYDLGDVGFSVSFDEATPRRSKHGTEGYLVECLIEVPAKVIMVEYWASLYSAMMVQRSSRILSPQKGENVPPGTLEFLKDLSDVPLTDGFTPLRGLTKVRRITTHVSEWSATDSFSITYL